RRVFIFSGYSATTVNRLYRLGGDPARFYLESRPQTTFEDALYSAALLKPKPSERWLLAAGHFSLAYAARCRMLSSCRISGAALSGRIGLTGFIRPYPAGSEAFHYLDLAAKEWIGHRLPADGQDRRVVPGAFF